MATKQRQLFDVAEYAEKARAALAKLEKTQQPGERAGKGGKNDVLHAVRSEVKAMLDKGYTTQQIAEAFKSDVFGILPKTITQVMRGTAHGRKARRTPAQAPAQTAQAANKSANETTSTKPGSLKINTNDDV